MRAPELWTRRGVLAGLGAGLVLPRLARAGLPDPQALSGWLGAPGTWTLSNATVQLPDGVVLEGAGVRIEDGVLVEVRQGLRGGRDLQGAWICPGLVDAGTTLGLVEVSLEGTSRDDDEASAAVTPDARVVDAYNPLSALVPVARTGALTHALVLPAEGRLVSGQAAVVRLAGLTVADATVRAPAGLCVSMGRAGTGGEGGPKGRMGVALRLRELLDAAEAPPDEQDGPRRRRKGKQAEDAEPDEERSPADEVWRQVRARELPLLVHAQRADDLLSAVGLAEDFDLDLVLVGAAEAWLVADQLARAGARVLLGPVDVQPSSFEHPHARYDNAAALHAAGVPFALRSGSAHNARQLATLAGLAVAHGLPRPAAVHAITAASGEILGLPHLGRLEPGQPASLALVAGDPLQPRYPVLGAWIDGREVSLETRQTRLYEAFKELR